jgi:hypothetical protein
MFPFKNTEEKEIEKWLENRLAKGITNVSSLDAIDAGFSERQFIRLMEKFKRNGIVKEI